MPMMANNMQQAGQPAAGQNGGIPRSMSKRDIIRMSKFNNNKAVNRWSDQMVVSEKEESAYQKFNRGRKTRVTAPAPPQPTPESRVSTTETPPKDEAMYVSEQRGSRPTTKAVSHNFEFSQYALLIRNSWNVMASKSTVFQRNCPFAMYQHVMVEILNAYVLQFQKVNVATDDLQPLMDALGAIRAHEALMPEPLYNFILSLDNATTSTNDKIRFNYPEVAIPQGPIDIPADPEADENADPVRVEAGSFGPPTAENHNVYECYYSPLVTKEFVAATIRNRDRDAYWNPFPQEWLPRGSRVNENLLGWWPTERLHADSYRVLLNCEFDNSDTITGRLRHCEYAFGQVHDCLKELGDKIVLVEASFDVLQHRENAAAFVYKRTSDEGVDYTTRLSDIPADLLSPYSFGSTVAGRAHYHGLKRERSVFKPGVFLTVRDGQNRQVPPEGWIATRNANFSMANPFLPVKSFRDRASLREDNHIEEVGEGSVGQSIHDWLSKTMVRKR